VLVELIHQPHPEPAAAPTLVLDNPNLQIGEYVLVKEGNHLPHHWPAVTTETNILMEGNTTTPRRPTAVTTNIHSHQMAPNLWPHKKTTEPPIYKFDSHRV
jgi:hypothetical protein